jgi:hypothetical protein
VRPTVAKLFAAAFLARIATWLVFPDPAYPDSFYYVAVARELAAGHGFQVPFLWNFVDVGGHLPAVAALPIPSNAHWMPLASIVQVPFIWLLGPSAFASSLPFLVLGAAAAPLTYLLGRDADLPDRVSIPAGALMILPGAASGYLTQPDNFALYMVLGALSLWACGRGLRGDRRAFALGGLAVGLATLSRTDGVILGLPFVVAFAAERWRLSRLRRVLRLRRPPAAEARPVSDQPHLPIGWPAAFGCFALFLLVVGPWLLRDLTVFGSLAPSSASGRILWLRDYEQLFSASDETTLATFLAQSPAALLASRVGGFVAALIVIGGTPLLFFLAPLALWGAWRRRADPAFTPWAIYGTAFLVFCGLIFAVHVPHGMALHSGLALVPHAYLLAFVGLEAAVARVAARRPRWDVPRAKRNLTVLVIAVSWIFAAAAIARLAAEWSGETADRMALLQAHPLPPGDRLMSPDPGAFWYRYGIVGVVTPNDPLPVIEQVARDYGVRWLVIEEEHVVPALRPVLDGAGRPDWISPPLAAVPATPASPVVPAGGAQSPGRAVLYAVCTSPSDARCSKP